ncbi:hypothetical protein P167DRAFT_539989 [Morchella conica CCBAS932]|uniref:Uncharacterized protein n=1 Tax=Morchella conica CCBAS932 TaxID=1392247 RepID=A0A3N4KAW4_9PEZI|nr:hypothetical protein P167DRAFT_539989 [Morchella conica CCBAS932]
MPIKDLFRSSKLGPEDGTTPATIISPIEEEITILSDITQELVKTLSAPPSSEQPLSVDQEQYRYLQEMFDKGVSSRNKIHHMIAEGDVNRAVVRKYEEAKKEFNYLLHAYMQGKTTKVEEKAEPEAKSLLKRAGDRLRKMKGSKGADGEV